MSAINKSLLKVQCLPPAIQRKSCQTNGFQTYCIKFHSLDGLQQVSTITDSYNLQAYLFDRVYHKIVGSVWRGKPVQVKAKKITFNQAVYFYTSLPVKDLLFVVEIIAVKENVSAGWLCMPLYAASETGTNLDNILQYKLPFLTGTPLVLLVLKKDIEGISPSQCTTGMEISLALSHHPLLMRLVHLVPENILFEACDRISGLIPESNDIMNDFNYVFKPRLQKCITYMLEKVCVKVRLSLAEAEAEILKKVQVEHNRCETSPKTTNATIVHRRLQIGLHNEFTFIQEADFYHLLVEPVVTPINTKGHKRSSSMGSLNFSRDEGLILRSDVKIPNVPDDPNIALVFLIEYGISFQNCSPDNNHSTSSVTKDSASNIAIAWGYCTLEELRINPSSSVTLTCNPANAPHKILFLKTSQAFKLTFTAYPVSKQDKNSSASVQSIQDYKSDVTYSNKTQITTEPSYFNSPVVHVAPKHKSLSDIPMSLYQNEVGSGRHLPARIKNTEHNNMQEIKLVPSSLALIPPMLSSFPSDFGIPHRVNLPFLCDKLQPVVDHHGKPATYIDSSLPYNVDMNAEIQSPPQVNECMMQLFAVSGFENDIQVPNSIYFTFQFYRFPPIKSESLLLKPLTNDAEKSDSKSSLVYALCNSNDKDQTIGYQVAYNIDPSELDHGEYKAFLQFLMKQTIHIDLWNGESLLYFGTVVVPLKYMCRQGKEAVFTILELDLINCEFPDDSLCQTALPCKTSRGKLHLCLSNVRHPLSTKSFKKMEEKEANPESVIIKARKGPSNADMNCPIISRAKPIIETDKDLSKLMSSRCISNKSSVPQDSNTSEERRRKLARMEAVRNQENENKSKYVGNKGVQHFIKERQRDLLSIESYINKNKSEMIRSLLHTSITTEKVIYPTIGSKSYFEFEIENPYPSVKKVEISWKGGELSLITDSKQWQLLRNIHKISQKVDFNIFSNVMQEVPAVQLQPKMKISVPFIYYCLPLKNSPCELFKATSGHHFSVDFLSLAPVSDILIPSVIKIHFIIEDGTLLAVLNLKIQPLPPSFTHVFKFLTVEHSMFKKSVSIRKENNLSAKFNIQCSDPEVISNLNETQDWEEDLNVHLKAPTRSSGRYREFYLFIYKDAYEMFPSQAWNISVYPQQRIDLSCVAGQMTRSLLSIRGTHSTNLVQCFTDASELQLHPCDSFVLSPFAVQELTLSIRSLLPGIKHFHIVMVNKAQDQILQSWLLVLSCQKPSVSKAFQVHLSVGKESTKRITYSNQYHQSRSFVLYSSHPQLLRLREYQFTIETGRSYSIGIYFLPQEYVFTETIFLYLNDSRDKNEETYCIKVICQ